MEELAPFLEDIDQLHLLEGIETLDALELESYKNQVLGFSPPFFWRQRNLLSAKAEPVAGPFEPPVVSTMGEAKVDADKVGCVILAGGDGTRLGHPGPKGCVEVVGGKSLFRLLIEKCDRSSPIAVIVSQRHYDAVERAFEEAGWYGRSRSMLRLVEQTMWPIMDLQGGWVQEKFGLLAMAPNGNGEALQQLYLSGCLNDWRELGVEFVSVSPIDNPLSPIGDLRAIEPGVELTLKGVRRKLPDEQVGLIVQKMRRPYVLEYIYDQPQVSDIAYTGMFTCTLAFLERVATCDLPWHRVEKQGFVRFETHVYDLFPFAKSHRVVCVDREKAFAPIKQKKGEASLEEAQKYLEKAS